MSWELNLNFYVCSSVDALLAWRASVKTCDWAVHSCGYITVSRNVGCSIIVIGTGEKLVLVEHS